jgi:dihydroorotate dehydrogenase (NAD+) catalytic subunit
MIEITRPGKQSLFINNPVMLAAGMMGYDASPYRDLIKLDKLGAMVTVPLTWNARGPARGPRVVPYLGGFLLHTGLPGPGIRQIIRQYRNVWRTSPIPVIAHLLGNHVDDVERCAGTLDGVEGVIGVELGLHDQADEDEIEEMVSAVRANCELPLLVKIPLHNAALLARIAEEAGADGLVIASPPRGTERDPITGQLVGGRLYGPGLKAQVLRAVGQVAQFARIPITACGGIHTANDARDFIAAGARAVQIDTLTWIEPSMVEIIARNLGGLELTRAIGALPDEWEPGIGHTVMMKRREAQEEKPPSPSVPPPHPPELPQEEEETKPYDPDSPF